MQRHIPVLVEEVLDALNLSSGKNIVDGTVGDAGHSEKILEKIGPDGELLAIDADPESLLRAKQFLYKFGERVTYVRDNFSRLEIILKEVNFPNPDGILFDFGWSSPQFANRNRGFSFQQDEPLDMRYSADMEAIPTAADVVAQSSKEQLEEYFSVYGEEKFAKDIAHEIIEKRSLKPIETTGQLVEIVLSVYRKELNSDKEVPWVGGLHPATKVFQALRIVVNDELGVIERGLPQAINVLKSGGRLAVITFHSLEDRIVKHYFKNQQDKTVKIITKKPIVCSEKEYKDNARARSAKLRVVEKI